MVENLVALAEESGQECAPLSEKDSYAIEQRGSAVSSKHKRLKVRVSCCVWKSSCSQSRQMNISTSILGSCLRSQHFVRVSAKNSCPGAQRPPQARNLFSLMDWQMTFRISKPTSSFSAYSIYTLIMQVPLISLQHQDKIWGAFSVLLIFLTFSRAYPQSGSLS